MVRFQIKRGGQEMKNYRVTIALVFTTIAMLAGAASASDPQKLVGEWKGEWSSTGARDALWFTVKSVDEDRVTCSVYIQGRLRYHNRDLPCSGTFAGGILSVTAMGGGQTVSMTLTLVRDGRLEGEARAENRATIWLERIK